MLSIKQLYLEYKMHITVFIYFIVLIIGVFNLIKEVPIFEGRLLEDKSDGKDYKHYTLYETSDILVFTVGEAKVVKIGLNEFTVYKSQKQNTVAYEVIYPNGKTYLIGQYEGTEYKYTINDNNEKEPYYNMTTQVKNTNLYSRVPDSFSPWSIIELAYDLHFQKRGIWYYFVLSYIATLIFHIILRNEDAQLFLFYLEHKFDVVDPEPSEFYYKTTKIGAVIGMIFGSIFMFCSVFIMDP